MRVRGVDTSGSVVENDWTREVPVQALVGFLGQLCRALTAREGSGRIYFKTRAMPDTIRARSRFMPLSEPEPVPRRLMSQNTPAARNPRGARRDAGTGVSLGFMGPDRMGSSSRIRRQSGDRIAGPTLQVNASAALTQKNRGR